MTSVTGITSISFKTKCSFVSVLLPPKDIGVLSGLTSFDVRWSKAKEMDRVPHHFLVSYHSPGTEPLSIYTEDCCSKLTNLQPGKEYTVRVFSVLRNGKHSEPVSETVSTSKIILLVRHSFIEPNPHSVASFIQSKVYNTVYNQK